MPHALVCGAGGFIGHHLTSRLKKLGYQVTGVDLKQPEYAPSEADCFLQIDLRNHDEVFKRLGGIATVDEVYQLAADMGGIGFITNSLADVAINNVRINANMLQLATGLGVQKYFYASSACVYSSYMQEEPENRGLRETDAHPAAPEPGYGWEKLFSEQLGLYQRRDHGLNVTMARFHNCYGPLGSWVGGREKAPAAVCRKIAMATSGDEIEVWGDGKQTRSYIYVDECVEGILRIAASGYQNPLNLGSTELVTVDELYLMVAAIAGKAIKLRHDLSKPQGVRGRNSDNTLIKQVLGWAPSQGLLEGLEKTYAWVEQQVAKMPKTRS